MSAPGNQAAADGVLLTSRDFGWQGILVQTRLHHGGEFRFGPFDDHLISLHLGAPIHIERSSDGSRVIEERMERGFAIIGPAEQPSLWRHIDTTRYLNLHLSRALLNRTAEQMALRHTSTLDGTRLGSFRDPHIEHLAMLLRLEMEVGAPGGSLYAETLASALSVHLLQRERGHSRLPPVVPSAAGFRTELRRAWTYIQDNLATDLSPDGIAGEAGLSPFHFARLFTEAYGVSPHQYVIQARIERAKALITRGGLSLGDAAQRVGFSDQSRFTRHFKRLVGITPRVFAQSVNRKTVLYS